MLPGTRIGVDPLILVASGGVDNGLAPVFLDNIVVRASTTKSKQIQEAEDARVLSESYCLAR